VADIRVTSTSRVFYQVPDVLAALLREAFPESFAKVEPKPTHNVQPSSNPAAPRWAVNTNSYLDRPQIMLIRPNGETTYYPGPDVDQWTASAAHAATVFEAIKLSCPKVILDQYEDARLLKQKQNVAAEQNYNRVRTT
jgi:hypothetical protein